MKDMATSMIKSNGGEYTLLASIRKVATDFTSYELNDDVKNYKFVYIATYGNGAPSPTTQSWGGTLIPTSMFVDKVFGVFVIPYQSTYFIEVNIGVDTRHISAKASDNYTRGITIYGIK